MQQDLIRLEPATPWRFKANLNEVSVVEGDSPPCSDLGKSPPETAILGTAQQIQPVVGMRADGASFGWFHSPKK